jgi:hypothetical protein
MNEVESLAEQGHGLWNVYSQSKATGNKLLSLSRKQTGWADKLYDSLFRIPSRYAVQAFPEKGLFAEAINNSMVDPS